MLKLKSFVCVGGEGGGGGRHNHEKQAINLVFLNPF